MNKRFGNPPPAPPKRGTRRAGGNAGFTLIELIITMFITTLVFSMTTTIFSALITQFKQQSKIAETSIEGAVGLEILRRDLESAGYGLPTAVTGVTYEEAADAPASDYNDCDGSAAADPPPRAIVTDNNGGTNATVNGSDYLVIKSLAVARNGVGEKFSTLRSDAKLVRWLPSSEALQDSDWAIVLKPTETGGVPFMELIKNPPTATDLAPTTVFSEQFGVINAPPWIPTEENETRIIYGVDALGVRFPFNRADYFIGLDGRPALCASNTGVLYKGVVSHIDDGKITTRLPLLDCVADMQVVFRLDTTDPPDGVVDGSWDDISGLTTALQVRQQVKQIGVYLLAHEGQPDPNYTHPRTVEHVGPPGFGHDFNLSTTIGGTWANYKWKVYRVIVKPENLR